MVVVILGLLFQEIRIGHRIVDILVFRIVLRLLALGLIAWVAVRSLRRDRPSAIARGVGGGVLMFAFLSGVRVSLVMASDNKVFHGISLLSSLGILLLFLWHSTLVIAGVLLLAFARRRAKLEQHAEGTVQK